MHAKTRNIRMSPRKLGIVASTVRGMPVEPALNLLKFSNKKGAQIIYKTLASAAANAENTENARRKDLKIESIMVQKGTALRRGKPVSRGRWHPIRKMLSHVYITLSSAVPPKQVKPAAKKQAESSTPISLTAKSATTKKPARKTARTTEKKPSDTKSTSKK